MGYIVIIAIIIFVIYKINANSEWNQGEMTHRAKEERTKLFLLDLAKSMDKELDTIHREILSHKDNPYFLEGKYFIDTMCYLNKQYKNGLYVNPKSRQYSIPPKILRNIIDNYFFETIEINVRLYYS